MNLLLNVAGLVVICSTFTVDASMPDFGYVMISIKDGWASLSPQLRNLLITGITNGQYLGRSDQLTKGKSEMYNFSPASCLVFYKVNEEPDALNWLDFLQNQTTSLTTYAEAAFWFPAGLKGEYDHAPLEHGTQYVYISEYNATNPAGLAPLWANGAAKMEEYGKKRREVGATKPVHTMNASNVKAISSNQHVPGNLVILNFPDHAKLLQYTNSAIYQEVNQIFDDNGDLTVVTFSVA